MEASKLVASLSNQDVKNDEDSEPTASTECLDNELDYNEEMDDAIVGESKLEDISSDEECEKPVRAKDKSDEGELSSSDGEDIEDGEVELPEMQRRPVCKYFQQGRCQWGLYCKFLHPGVNDQFNSDNIPMNIMSSRMPGTLPFVPMMLQIRMPQTALTRFPVMSPRIPDVYIRGQSNPAESNKESIWLKGLKNAKQAIKQAQNRRENEEEYEDKRLHLGVESKDEFGRNIDLRENPEKSLDKSPITYNPEDMYAIPQGHSLEDMYEEELSEKSFPVGCTKQKTNYTMPRGYRTMHSPSLTPSPKRCNSSPSISRSHSKERIALSLSTVRSKAEQYFDPWARNKDRRIKRETYSSVSSSGSSSEYSFFSSSGSSTSRSGSDPKERRKRDRKISSDAVKSRSSNTVSGLTLTPARDPVDPSSQVNLSSKKTNIVSKSKQLSEKILPELPSGSANNSVSSVFVDADSSISSSLHVTAVEQATSTQTSVHMISKAIESGRRRTISSSSSSSSSSGTSHSSSRSSSSSTSSGRISERFKRLATVKTVHQIDAQWHDPWARSKPTVPAQNVSSSFGSRKLHDRVGDKWKDKPTLPKAPPSPKPVIHVDLPDLDKRKPIKMVISKNERRAVLEKSKKREPASSAILKREKTEAREKRRAISRRDELLNQLRAVEDAISRKKPKLA